MTYYHLLDWPLLYDHLVYQSASSSGYLQMLYPRGRWAAAHDMNGHLYDFHPVPHSPVPDPVLSAANRLSVAIAARLRSSLKCCTLISSVRSPGHKVSRTNLLDLDIRKVHSHANCICRDKYSDFWIVIQEPSMDLSFREFGAMAIEGLHYPFDGLRGNGVSGW